MKQENRNTASDLLESTVKVIARDGFDKASTRKIAGECGIADAYIYVHFKDKADLFSKAFEQEDEVLSQKVRKYLSILEQPGLTNEERFCYLFSQIWKHLVSNPDSCRFFIQYYYSPYYAKYSAKGHLTRWLPALEQIKAILRPEADVRGILRPVLNTMLGQAVKAASEAAADKDGIARGNYELVLGMVNASLQTD